MTRELLAARRDGILAAIAFDQGKPIAIEADSPQAPPRWGWIARARVERLAGSDIAYLRLPDGSLGFLRDPPAGIEAGATLIVQIAAETQDPKADRLTAEPMLPGRLVAFKPLGSGAGFSRRLAAPDRKRLAKLSLPQGGFIFRAAAAQAAAEAIQAEAETLAAQWQSGQGSDTILAPPDAARRLLLDWGGPDDTLKIDDPAWDSRDFDSILVAALSPRLALPGGGDLNFGATEALAAIDVNAGEGERQAANRAAAAAIGRQLVLRNLAGLIVIDFVEGGRGDREPLAQALAQSLAQDPAAPEFGGFTKLGLFELARRRRRPPLSQILAGLI